MNDAQIKAELLSILKRRSVERGKFVLASGETSDTYLDIRTSSMSSEAVGLIGEAIYNRLKDLEIDAICGPAVGAVPLVTAAVMTFSYNGDNMEGLFVRGESKIHGTAKRVEGATAFLPKNARVAVVDDVITRGGSVASAVAAVKELGFRVVVVLGLVDRLQGARERLLGENVDVDSIFTIRDFE